MSVVKENLFIPLNTGYINNDDIQVLLEGPLVKQEKGNGKDTIRLEEGLAKPELDFTKKIEIAIRPNKQAMDALVANLRRSCITYQLASLVRLFLEKKERFDIFITALRPNTLFCTQQENLPFLSREVAFDYLIKKYWSDVFEKEVIPLSPITGNFTSINRCGITNVLLGPPNYHLYNDLLKEHYNQHLSRDYSWDFFVQQIKNEHNPSLIKQWQKGMAEHTIFRLKANPEIHFDSLYSAQTYLQTHPSLIKDSVKSYNAFSLSYTEVGKIKDEFLKGQIYQKIRDELRSPISLGCFCRTRFRHAGFHLYKKRKGPAYTSFLCAIKRKVRTEDNCELSSDLTRIVDYIERHPMLDMQTYLTALQPNTISPEDPQILKLKNNLIMLIKTGYVTQFENGTLYVSPKQKSPIQKQKRLDVVNG